MVRGCRGRRSGGGGCWHPTQVPPGTHHGCECWPRGGTAVPFLRLAPGGMGGLPAKSQAFPWAPAAHTPGRLHEATEEWSASSCQEGPVSSTISTWLPFLSALRTPILLFSHSVMSDFSQTHGLQPTISWSLLKFMSMESVMLSNHLMLCCPLLLLPSIFPSIRVFSNELALPIKWPKYWSFSFSISPSNEYLGLTSFRIDWSDLLAVQGTLKSLLQHHSLKASILWWVAFFVFQPLCLNHCYCSVSQSCPSLCDPMDCSTPGFPVLHHLSELAQTHVL